MKSKKFLSRKRRAKKIRSKIHIQEVARLSVHRSLKHIYAKVISPSGSKIFASASTVEKVVKNQLGNGGNIKAASFIGSLIAKRSLEAGVKFVAFDRSGYKYHGRVKALADAARAGGMQF